MGRNHYTTRKARSLGFRSGFEHEVVKELESLGVPFEYESEKCKFQYYKPVTKGAVVDPNNWSIVKLDNDFKVVQVCEYTCDFLIPKLDGGSLYIETKGRFLGKDRAKHELIKKQYPELDLRILFQQDGKATSKYSYLEWCEAKGILAAKIVKPTQQREGKYIPPEWLEVCIAK